MTIHSSVQIVSSFPHIEGIITLGAGEEVDEVAGGARGKIGRASCRERV